MVFPAVSFKTDNPTCINMTWGNLARLKIQHKKKVERHGLSVLGKSLLTLAT